MTVTEEDALPELVTLLGVPFLAYISAASEEQIQARLSGDLQALSEPSENAFMGALRTAAEWAWPHPEAPPARPDGIPADRMRRFGWFQIDTEQTIANLLRAHAGGSLLAAPDDLGTVGTILSTIAIDYFPVTLLPEPRPHQPVAEQPVIATSRIGAFSQAVAHDSTLARLLEAEPSFYTSTGFGYSAPDAARIAECCIATAELRVRTLNLHEPRDFVDAALDSLHIIRQLSQFGHADAPAMVGFTNVDVPDDFDLRTPRGGRLRAATQWDLRIPQAAPATIVLEDRFTISLHIGEVPPDTGDFYRGLEELNRDIQLISLSGLLLRDPMETPLLPLETWTKVFDPLQPYVGSFSRTRDTVSSERLGEDELADLEDWMSRIERYYHPALRVATKRAITALAERSTPEDSLIDLMIALESLFGGREGELTFRISSALAWLLGENSQERQRIQGEAKKAYAARSKIVHGEDVDPEEIGKHQERAQWLLLSSLKTLFTQRTDLIGDSARSNKLVLGCQDAV
jgi:hypothetical protein